MHDGEEVFIRVLESVWGFGKGDIAEGRVNAFGSGIIVVNPEGRIRNPWSGSALLEIIPEMKVVALFSTGVHYYPYEEECPCRGGYSRSACVHS